jgi:hypothetical protein
VTERTAWSLACLLLTGIPLCVVVPNFMRAHHREHITSCKCNLKNIGTALQMYASDNAGAAPPNLTYLTPNYLKRLPRCMSSHGTDYQYLPKKRDYLVYCPGDHTYFSLPQGYPQYSSKFGFILAP